VTSYISSGVYKECSRNLSNVSSAVYAYADYYKSTVNYLRRVQARQRQAQAQHIKRKLDDGKHESSSDKFNKRKPDRGGNIEYQDVDTDYVTLDSNICRFNRCNPKGCHRGRDCRVYIWIPLVRGSTSSSPLAYSREEEETECTSRLFPTRTAIIPVKNFFGLG
jgi:hypothetical protein